jgi:uncharacterized protein GlcG (DUF336 family)
MDESLIVRGGITLSAKGAELLIKSARETAEAMAVPMCIAVVDSGGNLFAFFRTDDARIANIQIAMTKATSAVTRRRATSEELAIRPEDPAQAIRTTLAAGIDRVTAMSGGIPLYVEGQLVGGIGVSGGTGREDIAVAQSAVDAFAEPEFSQERHPQG